MIAGTMVLQLLRLRDCFHHWPGLTVIFVISLAIIAGNLKFYNIFWGRNGGSGYFELWLQHILARSKAVFFIYFDIFS